MNSTLRHALGLVLTLSFTTLCFSQCLPKPADIAFWMQGSLPAVDVVSQLAGVARGGATSVPGRVAQAFRCNGLAGSGVYIDRNDVFSVQDFTIEAWVRRTDARVITRSGSQLYGTILGGEEGHFTFTMLNSGRLLLAKTYTSGVESSQGLVQDTNWHHVAVTKSGIEVKFFVDGRNTDTTSYSEVFVNATPMGIGAIFPSGLNCFWGDLSEVTFYRRPLSPTEIQDIADAGGSGKCLNDGLQIAAAAELYWVAEIGKQYQLQWRSRLDSEWSNLGDPVIGTGEPVRVFESARSQARRFYRVLELPNP
jgi:hypothetical protein